LRETFPKTSPGIISWASKILLSPVRKKTTFIKIIHLTKTKHNNHKVKLDYNELGYNKRPVITNIFFSVFSVPNPCLLYYPTQLYESWL
jgi:hypothetical protein